MIEPKPSDERVLARYLDDLSEPEEFAELDRRLRDDPDLRQALLRTARLDLALTAMLRLEAETPSGLGAARSGPSSVGRRPRTILLAAMAAAAAILLVIGGWWRWGFGASPAGLRVEVVHGTVLRGGVPLTVGAHVQAGDRIETGSASGVVCSYADGTVLKLADHSTLDVTGTSQDRKKVTLSCGSLWANVQPQRTSMVLSTPEAQATVLGTGLRLISNAGVTVLAVAHGHVALQTGTERVEVGPGASAQAGEGTVHRRSLTPTPAEHEGEVLWSDTFDDLATWSRYYIDSKGTSTAVRTKACPEIRIEEGVRAGRPTRLLALTGRPGRGVRVAHCVPGPCSTRASVITYDYTFVDRPRRAMEGLVIDGPGFSPWLELGEAASTDEETAPGVWHRVRWEIRPMAGGLEDELLFFDDRFYGRRRNGRNPSAQFHLQVMDGELRCDNLRYSFLSETP